ncbi:MAG TPA: Asp-tRNA(Asn)/Glu-tRNA(Gln) amidotransferase subunit GatC [Methanofastidiosum sp.]|nr:Asp-tRNA(Asn)/Glu-tRNA(Gln) amidotransferase subunit GatC [Methanofastidiosum sp.]HOC78489.1 Asp-tRNA(Asn)/Glu-tRNA(Gln) amidotransferase subunit GatC [Methanofastidiosum sp.]HOG74023.1 Asp-tRNA(Asn)/Glu-tRNA(Gln) amidotransferase subunit GatC [Methanofastidiosum sp.]HPA49283.1 Asp-tRNA(Asn)/Glu-tRNA(Gln) amidotransferase subunit GatC [Methanofastidiosum sp.]HQK63081.1 Asp-tRNA(Asn)/Glu-tRNA(Gln) amidotransferase subunit GatC [Methanofastidiosum sp.]
MVETIINENTIERVSEIARLKLSDKEKIRFRDEFERILEEFSIIDEIKVGDKELYYVVENVNVLREDSSPKPFNKINDIKNNFNKKEDEYIVVPRNL